MRPCMKATVTFQIGFITGKRGGLAVSCYCRIGQASPVFKQVQRGFAGICVITSKLVTFYYD